MIYKEQLFYLFSKKLISVLKIMNTDLLIKPLNLKNIIKSVKPSLSVLTTNTAVDQIDKFNRFLLIHVFTNYIKAQRIYFITNTNLTIFSLAEIFPSAIWLEREIYDLFGIYFLNPYQADLRRLLTDYHFKGHPMRKEFSLIGYREKRFSYLSKTVKTKMEVIF